MLNLINAHELEKIKKNLTTAFWKVKQDISQIKKLDQERDKKLNQLLKQQIIKPETQQVKSIEKPIIKPEQEVLIFTPTQKLILKTLIEDEADLYLSYKDIGNLTNRSAHAIRIQINKLQEKGIKLEYIIDISLQKRFKIPSKLKQKYREVIA